MIVQLRQLIERMVARVRVKETFLADTEVRNGQRQGHY